MAVDFSAARSTDDLLVDASNGDTSAIDELYRRHKTAGTGYARRRGADDPEAIYDHVFVDVLAKAEYLSTERPNGFVAYLHRSIKNRIIQEARRKRPVVTLEGDRADPLDVEAGFEDLVVGSAWVEEAFAGLTDAQREVMEGRYIEQRSLADIADRLGKSPASVRQLHRAALSRLRVLLAVGAALLVAAAAVWIVRELAATSVDTSPVDRIDRLDRDGMPTGPPGSDDEQGMAPLADLGRLTGDRNERSDGSEPGAQLPFAEPTPPEGGLDGPNGSTSTTEPDGVAPPSTEATDSDLTSTTTTGGTEATATSTTESTPDGGSPVPTSSRPPAGATTAAPNGGAPPGPATTALDGPPGTVATTTSIATPALAPPSGGLIAYDPFFTAGFQTFGFDPDSPWTVSRGQLTLGQLTTGLSYTDRRGQNLVDGAGAVRVSGLSGTSEIRRPLPAIPSGQYGYAVSFLIRVDTPTFGRAFWTPDGGEAEGAAGIQAPRSTITFIDGAPSGIGIEQGETVLVAVQVIGNVANLWVNPRLDRPGQPSASHKVVITDPTHAVFGFGGSSEVRYTIDEFRIGSTIADVLPYTVS